MAIGTDAVRSQIRFPRFKEAPRLEAEISKYLEREQNGGVNQLGLRLQLQSGVPIDPPAANQPNFVLIEDGTGLGPQPYVYVPGTGWVPVAQTALPAVHVLATTGGIGPQHSVSGLTARQVLRASGASAVNFQVLTAADLDAGTFPAGTFIFTEQLTINSVASDPSLRFTRASADSAFIKSPVSGAIGLYGSGGTERMRITLSSGTTILDVLATDFAIKLNGATKITVAAALTTFSDPVTMTFNGADALLVSGSTSAVRPVRITSNATDTGLSIENTTAAGLKWTMFSSGTGSGLVAGALNIRDETGGTVRLSMTSSTATFTGGVGGLALLSGGAALNASINVGRTARDGDFAAVGLANAYVTGSAVGDTVVRAVTGDLWLAVNSTGTMRFAISGVTLATMTSSGFVGIGTAPSYALDVQGAIRNRTAADASPNTMARIWVYGGTTVDTSNWGYFGYSSAATLMIVYAKTGAGNKLQFGTTSAADNTGTFTETMSLSMAGLLTVSGKGNFGDDLTSSGHLGIAATKKLYLDGVALSGDTFIVESGANVMDLVSGGATILSLTSLTAITKASVAGGAGFRLPHGSAPSAPTDGDTWTTTAGLFARINGVTIGPYGTGSGSGTITSSNAVAAYVPVYTSSTNIDIKNGANTRLVAGSTGLVIRNNADSLDRFVFLEDGRFYGLALHDNAGAVTGTTNQYIASGTYTPTLFNTTNVTSSTALGCFWMRVGNVVTVAGGFDATPTTIALNTTLGLSVPIASNLSGSNDVGGSAHDSVGTSCQASADGTNDRVIFRWAAPDTSSRTYIFIFTYIMR